MSAAPGGDQAREASLAEDLQKVADAAAWSGDVPVGTPVPLNELSWLPSGPVARAFVVDPAPVTLICGPWGSGKTTALFIKLLLCACAVPPSPLDGVRYARVAIVRDTYRNLETNTIPSWHERFSKDLGKWKGGGGGEPGAHVIDFLLPDDGSILHLEVLFVAVGDHNVKQFCDGLQLTACAMNGMDELPPELLGYMRPRTGRWPPPQHRPENWKQFVKYWRKLMADMNAPELDNHTVKDFQTTPLPGYKMFLQPSGLTPEAENLENLPDGYYEELAAGKEEWWVARFIENKFGFSRSGKPVYTRYREDVHLAKKALAYNPKRLLVFGLDAQKDACAIAMQRDFNGRVNWLREFIPPQRMAAKQFGKWLAGEIPIYFPDLGDYEFCGDPAGFDPNGVDDDATWMEFFGRAFLGPEMGDDWSLYVKKAPTNDLSPRIESVNTVLAEVDGFALCPVGCPKLRRAFNSGYRFGDSKTYGDQILTGDPIKNEYSHPMEAGQYGTMRLLGMRHIAGRPRRERARAAQAVDFDPLDYR